MRLINADELKSMYSINRANFNTVVGIQKWIDDAPTVNAIPISIIEDIKAEIKAIPYQRLFGSVSCYSMLDVILEIIDKHIGVGDNNEIDLCGGEQ